LAAIPKSPVEYDPADQPQASKGRAALVLDAMVETGAITDSQRAEALAHPPRIWKTAANAPAQYFVDWLDGQTRALVGPPRQDEVVETTLDMPLESAAADSARTVLARGAGLHLGQAALVSLDGYGRMLAMVGGADYGASPYNRAIAARRQAGSSWKPFVYLTALEAGRTPDTPVVDEPVTIDGWSPRNFEEGYLGPITLQTALAQSINTVAARLADQVGRSNVAATAKRLGITAPINTDPAMALGTTQVTPLEMAQAYSTFADAGYRNPIYAIERIRAGGGQVLYQHRASPPAQVIANPPLSELNQMLRQVVLSGTGVHAALPGYDIAGKTGTTSDFKDAWFCGFTGDLITVVWMGRDDSSPMRGVTGGSAPAAFWHDYMRVAVKRERVWAIPPGPQAAAPPVLPAGAAPSIAPFPPPLSQPPAPQPQQQPQPPTPGDDGGPLG
jgi:penicillin-binding protein 1A